MTVMLEKNKHILKQITTLSTLMVNLSSCIKFDRYSGYDSTEELNAVAEDLVKNRNLYASAWILGLGARHIHDPQHLLACECFEWILVDFAFMEN